MTEVPAKRKRITSDILSFTKANTIVPNQHNHDKIKKIEALVSKLEHEKLNLETQIKWNAVSQKLALEEQARTIAELVESKAECQKRAVYHKERYDEAAQTLATMKEKHTAVANELRESLEQNRQKIEQLEEIIRKQTDEIETLTAAKKEQEDRFAVQIDNLTQNVNSMSAFAKDRSLKIQMGLMREVELTEKINSLEQQVSNMSEYPTNPQAYQELEAHYQSISKRTSELERENIKLARDLKHYKGISQNIELLREERESLAQQLKSMDQIREQNFEYEVENIKLKTERASWADYLESQPEFNSQTPDSIIYQLTKQAEDSKYLKKSVEQYQQQIADQLDIIRGMEAHMDELKKKAVENERLHALDESARDILVKSSEALKRHISILEGQLTMYDHEEMSVVNQENYDQAKAKRIAELEGLLKEHEDRILSQAQELAQLKSQNASQLPPVQIPEGPYEKLESGASLSKLLSNLSSKEEKLVKELQEKTVSETLLRRQVKSAQEQISLLSKSILNQQARVPSVATSTIEEPTSDNQASSPQEDTGSEDTHTRVLQLLDNPASNDLSVRTSILESLRKENKDLLSQLRSMDVDVVTVPNSTIENFEVRISELQAALQAREKRIQRLQEVWEAKHIETSTQIRNMLGYNVIPRSDGITRFENVHVDPAELAFAVKTGDHDHDTEGVLLRMVGSEKEHYMEELEDIYQSYIIQDRNVPAFLNAAALEFYVSAKLEKEQRERMDYMEEEVQFADEYEEEDEIEPYDEDTLEPYDEDTRIHVDDENMHIHIDDDDENHDEDTDAHIDDEDEDEDEDGDEDDDNDDDDNDDNDDNDGGEDLNTHVGNESIPIHLDSD